jgi:hypothetical protein
MSCKNDQNWEGSYTYKGSCVKWWELVTLRRKFNQLWDLLKIEDRQPNVKYGFSTDEEENAKEQTEFGLARIEGFCSVRFDENGDYDEIYFRITSGSIINRINQLGTQYSYANQVGGQSANFGPWIVYLNDPCYGCTGFRFQNADIPYRRTISCNCMNNGDGCFPNLDIDPSGWKAQCIWTRSGGCNSPATPISDWQQYCHFNFDWRSAPFYQTKFGDVAKRLFAKEICAPVGKPCTVSRNYCCDEYALAHYTEEFMDHASCPQNETAIAAGRPFNEWPYRKRRLKWVSLGVTLTNPQDEQQPFDDDTFFCCNNSITGGVFKGWVTQKISAIHLTDIWDRVNDKLGGQPLRTCSLDQCQYHWQDAPGKRWVYEEKIPMYISGSTPDIMDRRTSQDYDTASDCNNCDKTAVGQPICACNFNDINSMLDEYMTHWAYCYEGKYKEQSLLAIGPLENCIECLGHCCCDCQCGWGYTKEECEDLKCEKHGPKWLGPYKKGESYQDKYTGQTKPCGCSQQHYDYNNETGVGKWVNDPGFPDSSCHQTCGTTSACCSQTKDGCGCWQVTKCQCEAVDGVWKGYNTKADENGYVSLSRSCWDDDIRDQQGCVSDGYSFGNLRGGESSEDGCDTCGDSESGGGGTLPDGVYECSWGVDDRGYVNIAGTQLNWSAQGYGCACFGAGGGDVKVTKGGSVSGFGESASGNVGWYVFCSCSSTYDPYDYPAWGKYSEMPQPKIYS